MVEPTAPPRCLPPWNSTGQVNVPLTCSVPVFTSASAVASPKPMDRDGSPATWNASPRHSTCSGATSRRRAAASTRACFSLFAASRQALPTMKVTREE